jgi:hypothetical protein
MTTAQFAILAVIAAWGAAATTMRAWVAWQAHKLDRRRRCRKTV